MAKATPKNACYILYIISSWYIEFAHVKQPTSTPNDIHTTTRATIHSHQCNIFSLIRCTIALSFNSPFLILSSRLHSTVHTFLRLTFSSLALSFPHIFRAIKLYIRINTLYAQIHQYNTYTSYTYIVQTLNGIILHRYSQRIVSYRIVYDLATILYYCAQLIFPK